MKIQLSVEEGLAYQKFDAELKGFAAGVARTLEFVRGQKIEAIMQSRQTAEPSPNITSGEGK